jgi:uncharacterized protein YndB with AHSA1/START domain
MKTNDESDGQLPEIRKTIVLETPVEKVWKAISTSDGIAGWWMANTFEPKIGHEFVLHAGEYGDSKCRIVDIVPFERVEFKWDEYWTLTFEVKSLNKDRTEFTLIHSGWNAKLKSRFGQPHSKIREVMSDGWENIVNKNLAEYVKR